MSLLPRGKLAVPGLEVSALCVPAREVGGDYFDFLPIDDNRLGVLIADVSGKGTSAAFYMAELKGVILSLSRTCPSPRQLLLTANRDHRGPPRQPQLHHDDLRRHRPRRRGRWSTRAPATRRSSTGRTAGRAAGGGPHARTASCSACGSTTARCSSGCCEEDTLPLSRGDVLVLFTDGISEAMNPESDMFGEARLAELVGEHGHLPVEELRERILREIEAFRAGAPQHDDMTMILLKVEEFVRGRSRRRGSTMDRP